MDINQNAFQYQQLRPLMVKGTLLVLLPSFMTHWAMASRNPVQNLFQELCMDKIDWDEQPGF